MYIYISHKRKHTHTHNVAARHHSQIYEGTELKHVTPLNKGLAMRHSQLSEYVSLHAREMYLTPSSSH